MAFVSSVMSWIMKQRIHEIELFLRYPHEVQEELLHKLIRSARNTEYGLQHDFASITTTREFKDRLPINNYNSLKPTINRIMKGEQNLLWFSDIKWFAKSSGTTSDKSKFIPVSLEALEECHYKGGKDLLSLYCNNYPDTRLFNGKLLSLGGSQHVNAVNSEAIYGDLSAILIQNLPFWVQMFRTPDITVALMDEWEEKILKMASITMKEDVTNISGVPSWTLVLLKKILELSGKNNIQEVWPNLELFVHGAVNFDPYRDQFARLIPNPGMHYLETYNASEGFFGIQDQKDSSELLLMLDYGIYYEFIPVDELNNENPSTLSLDQVEVNKNYALLITTNAGLWRYKIGDTIMFTSLSPFRIKITGRTLLFINAFGEELIIDNAEKAVTEACKRTGAHVREYTAAPVYFDDQSSGAHEWLFEFEQEPDNLNQFAWALDDALKKLNSDYEAKRYRDMALRFPIVKQVSENTFYEWLRANNKLGGQHKIPRLANNRQFLDQILKFNNVEV